MEFNYTDSLVLVSIFNTGGASDGAALIDVIAFADYADHSILNFDEFASSLNKLAKAGIIEQRVGRLFTTDTYTSWQQSNLKKYKRIYIGKMIDRAKEYINSSFLEINFSANTGVQVSQDEYSKAVEIYLKRSHGLPMNLNSSHSKERK